MTLPYTEACIRIRNKASICVVALLYLETERNDAAKARFGEV